MPDPEAAAKTKRAFDRLAADLWSIDDDSRGWHRSNFTAHRKRYESDVALIASLHQGGPLLEVGAAPCHLTAALHALGHAVVGVDIGPDRVQGLIDKYGLDVRKCDIETERLPFDDASFALVVFSEVFEHLRRDPLFALSEVNRVTRMGGALLLTTPNLYSLQNIFRFLAGRGINDPVVEFSKLRGIGHMGHIREYSVAEMRRFLSLSNFSVRQLSFHHYHYPRSLRGLAAFLAFTLLPRRFRTFQVMVALKTGPSPGLNPID